MGHWVVVLEQQPCLLSGGRRRPFARCRPGGRAAGPLHPRPTAHSSAVTRSTPCAARCSSRARRGWTPSCTCAHQAGICSSRRTPSTHTGPRTAPSTSSSPDGANRSGPRPPNASFTLGSVKRGVRASSAGRDRDTRAPHGTIGPLSSRRRGCRRESTCDAVTESPAPLPRPWPPPRRGGGRRPARRPPRLSAKCEVPGRDEGSGCAQNVHYVSKATEQGISLEVVGDTGKTSGSQVLEVQNGLDHRGAVGRPDRKDRIRAGERSRLWRRSWASPRRSRAPTRTDGCPSRPAHGSLSELVSGLLDSDVASSSR